MCQTQKKILKDMEGEKETEGDKEYTVSRDKNF